MAGLHEVVRIVPIFGNSSFQLGVGRVKPEFLVLAGEHLHEPFFPICWHGVVPDTMNTKLMLSGERRTLTRQCDKFAFALNRHDGIVIHVAGGPSRFIVETEYKSPRQ
jgi:hypothetical protein